MRVGKIREIEQPDHRVQTDYDQYGRPIEVRERIDTVDYVSKTAYDSYSRPSIITYPTQLGQLPFEVENVYDNRGRLIEVREPGGNGTSYWKEINVDARGNTFEEDFGNGGHHYQAVHRFNRPT